MVPHHALFNKVEKSNSLCIPMVYFLHCKQLNRLSSRPAPDIRGTTAPTAYHRPVTSPARDLPGPPPVAAAAGTRTSRRPGGRRGQPTVEAAPTGRATGPTACRRPTTPHRSAVGCSVGTWCASTTSGNRFSSRISYVTCFSMPTTTTWLIQRQVTRTRREIATMALIMMMCPLTLSTVSD